MTQRERRLGRGLESLISSSPRTEAGTASSTAPGRVRHLPLAAIDPNPFQPRREFPVAELNELVESLREHGLLQPVVVRAVGMRYQLVAGERRWRAAGELGWTEIAASVIDADDRQMLEWALIENIQRQDLGPLELAEAYRSLIDSARITQDELARRLGLSRPAIANTLRLLDLPGAVKERVSRGTVSMGAARAILGLPNVEEQIAVARRVENGELTVRQVERLAAAKRPTQAVERRLDPNLGALSDEMQRILGTKVRIKGSMKRGKVVVEYYSPSQLDGLIRRLRHLEGVAPTRVTEGEASEAD